MIELFMGVSSIRLVFFEYIKLFDAASGVIDRTSKARRLYPQLMRRTKCERSAVIEFIVSIS